MDTSERRVLSLEDEGFPCIPVLGLSRYRSTRPHLDEHCHPECLEISFCARAPLVFECEGRSYTLTPGHVFITQPQDRHHLVTNPKGMYLRWMFFRLPRKGKSVLGLPLDESNELVRSLTLRLWSCWRSTSDRFSHDTSESFAWSDVCCRPRGTAGCRPTTPCPCGTDSGEPRNRALGRRNGAYHWTVGKRTHKAIPHAHGVPPSLLPGTMPPPGYQGSTGTHFGLNLQDCH